jgi:hypothetical protein
MKTIKDLEKIGFLKAGEWLLLENGKIDFRLDKSIEFVEDILYAFESDGLVKYIGITEQSIKSRMINYKSGHEENKSSGTTNKKVNKEIKKLLTQKKTVFIYYLVGNANCDYFGLRISLSTGIEKSLIKNFDENNNLWNSRGVIKQKVKKNELDYMSKKQKIATANNQTIIRLGLESFNRGFILFKNDVDHLLPIESEGIDIHYNDIVISGWFTRSQGNKKVNGYNQLINLINRDFKLKEQILVTILNPNEIKIEKIKI